ncbi:MAG: hypothetical protein IJ446_11090 [Oscillospiraceae bacterium]|nr:hypothetical protein [Oscillospiraceae bacterium]
MNLKKIVSAIAAGAMALTMTAFNAFAATTVEIDTESPGSWSSSGKGITKAELEAVGGDVKIVLEVETLDPYGLADQFLVNPIDYDNGWVSQTDYITSDTIVAKTDGWICVRKSDTSLEFVLSADAIPALGDSGLCFSAQNVLVKSATYELGDKQGEVTRVDDAAGKEYCFSEAAAEEAAPAEEEAPAEEAAAEEAAPETTEEAPASDNVTAPATTGNASAYVIVAVMAVAGAAAVASKKRN